MENELFYRLALTRVPGIGAFRARILFNQFGEAGAIFKASPSSLAKIRGIGQARAREVAGFKQFQTVEKELAFLEKFRIKAVFFTDKDYPRRMTAFKDAPVILYYKGNADLNMTRVIAIVGTRNPSEYGKQVVDHFVKAFSVPDLLVVSGLAYGIDAASHQAALRNGVPTVGVLGHGLDRIYPQQHAALARQMVNRGGLLTEFGIGTEPKEYNFPARNRIIAGMSDAIIVVETSHRGGSMLTVENAMAYRKKVYACPGRINDDKSAGCNALIRKGKACLVADPRQVIEEMQWGEPDPGPKVEEGCDVEGSLGAELELPDEEKIIFELIRSAHRVPLDSLLAKAEIPGSRIHLALVHLELKGFIRSLPGKIYCVGAGGAGGGG